MKTCNVAVPGAGAIGAVEWFIVEQEKYNHPPLEAGRLCHDQLRRWGRV